MAVLTQPSRLDRDQISSKTRSPLDSESHQPPAHRRFPRIAEGEMGTAEGGGRTRTDREV
jgi:hypothetical protein